MLGMLSATVAFSIDAMLPALPDIAFALSPNEPNRAQLVVVAFVTGMAFGTLFSGPLSNAFGRRPVALVGAAIYIVAALVAAIAQSIEALLVARVVQGVGAAGPRIVAMALVRDLFSGRQMARIMSFIMIVFTLVPVLAPTLGAAIAWAFGWRAIFLSFAAFSIFSVGWLMLRQPETLLPENRRAFRFSKLANGVGEVLGNRQVVLAIAIQSLIFGVLFSALLSSQQVFGEVFGRADSFPLWFGLIAAISSSANVLNAYIVVRLGMRMVVKWALVMLVCMTGLFLAAQLSGLLSKELMFPLFVIWMTSVFFMAGLGIGNMNAIAMEPLGHLAGLAASIISAVTTVASIVLAAPVGQAFNGTTQPLTFGVLTFALLALVLIRRLKDTADPGPKIAV
jgi:MFS transporter, DHA1 family, multidrug resistance protein